MRLLLAPFVGCVVACTGSSSAVDAVPFTTFQACWDDHNMEGFSIQRAIELCCIDDPIGDALPNTVCGDTATTCTAFVTANLSATDAMPADIIAACNDYVAEDAG